MSTIKNVTQNTADYQDDFDREFFRNVGENFEIAEKFFSETALQATAISSQKSYTLHPTTSDGSAALNLHLQSLYNKAAPSSLLSIPNTKKRSLIESEKLLAKEIKKHKYELKNLKQATELEKETCTRVLEEKIKQHRFNLASNKRELQSTVSASRKALSEKAKAEKDLKILRSQISILSAPYCDKCNEVKLDIPPTCTPSIGSSSIQNAISTNSLPTIN